MTPLIILLSYLLIRPALTLLTELPRAWSMTAWKGGYPVTVFLGTQGHTGGWSVRTGKLIWRIHPYLFLLRGSISDTHARPSLRQFQWWCISPLLISLLIFVTCSVLFLLNPFSQIHRLIGGGIALLSMTDLGVGLLRETEPRPMHFGLVHVGNGATFRLRFQYQKGWMDYLRGLHAYLRGDFAKALTEWDDLLSIEKNEPEIMEDAAYAAFVLGYHEQSLLFYRQIVEAAGESIGHRCVAAMCLIKSGKQDEALNLLNQTLAYAPGNHLARNLRGLILMSHGETKQAVVDLKVATLAPEYATAWANLAECLIHDGNWEAARAALKKAEEQEPFDLNILHVRNLIDSAPLNPKMPQEHA